VSSGKELYDFNHHRTNYRKQYSKLLLGGGKYNYVSWPPRQAITIVILVTSSRRGSNTTLYFSTIVTSAHLSLWLL